MLQTPCHACPYKASMLGQQDVALMLARLRQACLGNWILHPCLPFMGKHGTGHMMLPKLEKARNIER